MYKCSPGLDYVHGGLNLKKKKLDAKSTNIFHEHGLFNYLLSFPPTLAQSTVFGVIFQEKAETAPAVMFCHRHIFDIGKIVGFHLISLLKMTEVIKKFT